MIIKECFRLPVSGAGCGKINISANSIQLVLKYEFISEHTGEECVGIIKFMKVVSFKFRKEAFSSGFVEDSYDSIVQVENSEWLHDIVKIEPKGLILNIKHQKHFAVFLSNNGYLEVIAEAFEVMEQREGYLN